jgi:hypothetical protein
LADRVASSARGRLRHLQRGFVVGRRFAGAFLTAGFCAALLACTRVGDFAADAFFFAAGFLPGVSAAPDATRDECFARHLTAFGRLPLSTTARTL